MNHESPRPPSTNLPHVAPNGSGVITRDELRLKGKSSGRYTQSHVQVDTLPVTEDRTSDSTMAPGSSP